MEEYSLEPQGSTGQMSWLYVAPAVVAEDQTGQDAVKLLQNHARKRQLPFVDRGLRNILLTGEGGTSWLASG
jgi:hypothetical protein